jgi:hypothetical protein
MYRSLVIATALMPFATFAAEDLSAGCHCGGSSAYVAPSTSVVRAPVAPPTAPMAGQTQQYRTVEPQVMPPAAPARGYTYRNYSVQPQQSFRRSPQGTRPQDEVINRKLHPGTYSFR